ncbi:MAG: methyltransferase domain-containing protein [Candidatus Aminicenantes bacterium]|nr:methyltransferase domain-containing protein [Candidatus Aminicenantes bacterium]
MDYNKTQKHQRGRSTLSTYLGILNDFCRDRHHGQRRWSKGLRAFIKTLAYYFLFRQRVDEKNYAEEYNHISQTYHRWLQLMGKHTNKIITFDYLPETQCSYCFLDLAAGTGYITRRILAEWDSLSKGELLITAADISESMLSILQAQCSDTRVSVVKKDATAFLNESRLPRYDAIFFGWALPYFEHRSILNAIVKRLKPGGIVHCICNSQGTLNHIDSVFIDVTVNHPDLLVKVPGMSLNLPDGKEGLSQWFRSSGLMPLMLGEGNEEVEFDRADELYRWLCETGALVGTRAMFSHHDIVEPLVIERIEQLLDGGNGYRINHRFVYGIFQKNRLKKEK